MIKKEINEKNQKYTGGQNDHRKFYKNFLHRVPPRAYLSNRKNTSVYMKEKSLI